VSTYGGCGCLSKVLGPSLSKLKLNVVFDSSHSSQGSDALHSKR
jgi:hypothetical protein